MTNLKSVSILEPCHQSWQKMTAVSNGRHCQSCCKTVTDFTKMTNIEIISYLAAGNNICGRFEEYQLSSINTQLNLSSPSAFNKLKGWAMALGLFSSILTFRASAQTGEPMIRPVSDSANWRSQNITIGKVAAPKCREINGHVTDELNQAVPGVSITFAGSDANYQTNVNGDFKLSLPLSVTKITLKYIGYNARTVSIEPDVIDYQINLQANKQLLGDIMVIKRSSFLKRTYQRFIKFLYKA